VTIADLLDRALDARAGLVERLHAEETDSYRLFHGVAEGLDGLTIDRYGPLVLVQTFRERPEASDIAALEARLRERLGSDFEFAWNHRPDRVQGDSPEHVCRESGVRFLVRARHRGQDPWLFLDLRAGRRRLRELSRGKSVLNLFAYTCSAGVCAAASGASEVLNVDVSRSGLYVGKLNAELNGIPETRMQYLAEDCLPVLRQLADQPVKGRGAARPYTRLEPRVFDLVVLDPPAWAKGPFGAVDLVRDYPSLLKPALLATAPGGTVLATNHVASVALEDWLAVLRRTAEKSEVALAGVEAFGPEVDFPSRDGRPPLKIALLRRADPRVH